jgi:hypothetical protein
MKYLFGISLICNVGNVVLYGISGNWGAVVGFAIASIYNLVLFADAEAIADDY